MAQNNLGKRNIKWVGRKTAVCSKSSADVTVTIQKMNGKTNRVAFRFIDELSQVVAPSGWMAVGICQDRVYFKDDNINGMKCTGSKSDKKKQINVRITEDTEAFKEFVGEYTLLFDKYAELYYIQKKPEEVSGDECE